MIYIDKHVIQFLVSNHLSTSILTTDCTTDTHCQDIEVCEMNGLVGMCSNPCDTFESSCLKNQSCIVTNRQPSCECKIICRNIKISFKMIIIFTMLVEYKYGTLFHLQTSKSFLFRLNQKEKKHLTLLSAQNPVMRWISDLVKTWTYLIQPTTPTFLPLKMTNLKLKMVRVLDARIICAPHGTERRVIISLQMETPFISQFIIIKDIEIRNSLLFMLMKLFHLVRKSYKSIS